MQGIYDILTQILRPGQILTQEPMSAHTTFRIGGPADYLVLPETQEQIALLTQRLNAAEIPFYIIGNGSNLLVSDSGYRGVIIQLGKQFSSVEITPGSDENSCRISAKAGAMLAAVSKMAARESYTGMEFASGIPGSIGGAMVMNAGAYGGEMKDITVSVTLLDPDGSVREVPNEQMEFGYRTSLAGKTGAVVLDAMLALHRGNIEEICARMDELKEQRTSKQPLDLPSAGSTFKRPAGYFAGKLIMDAGLRGYRVGGACVSEKHCGFVVNTGGATADDVYRLIDDVRQRVLAQTGILLEPEIKMIGQF